MDSFAVKSFILMTKNSAGRRSGMKNTWPGLGLKYSDIAGYYHRKSDNMFVITLNEAGKASVAAGNGVIPVRLAGRRVINYIADNAAAFRVWLEFWQVEEIAEPGDKR